MLDSQIPQREIVTVSPLYRWLTIVFALLSIITSGFILSSVFGKSTIILTPETQEIDLPFALAIYKDVKNDNEQAGIIAEVKETSLEKNIVVSLPKSPVTAQRAIGQVIITNKSNKQQTLVTSTQLMAENNKIYRLNNTIVVSPGKDIKASVTADADGPEYDIGKSKLVIVKLRDDLKPLIYATTEKIDRQVEGKAEVNETTIANGLEEAKSQLTKDLVSELKKQGQINEKTLSVSFYRQSYDNKSITANGELIYTVGAIAKATSINNQDIANVIAQNLPEEIEKKYAIIDPLQIDFKTEYSATGNNELGIIKGSAKIKTSDFKINKSDLTSKSVNEVEKILSDAGATDIKIILPFWQKNLPRLSANIEIQIKK